MKQLNDWGVPKPPSKGTTEQRHANKSQGFRMHYHSRYLKKNFDPNRRRPNRNVTKIFEKFSIPHNLWKTLISGQYDLTKIEEESNEKFSMNPYLKAKT